MAAETAKLNDLKQKSDVAKTKLSQKQEALKAAQNKLEEAKAYVKSLQNAPQLLAAAKAELATANENLKAKKESLEKEVATLADLKTKQAATEADHKKLVKAYQDYLEAQRQAKIAKEKEAIEANGGIPVPVVNEEGVITGYVDCKVSTDKSVIQNSYNQLITKKVTENLLLKPKHARVLYQANLPKTNDSSDNWAIIFGLLFMTIGLAEIRRERCS